MYVLYLFLNVGKYFHEILKLMIVLIVFYLTNLNFIRTIQKYIFQKSSQLVKRKISLIW